MSDNKETKQAPAVEAKSYDPFNPIDGVISNKAPAVEAAREATCATCKGLGVVDDGEITGSGGVEFENGPIKCFKDCPQCVVKRHVVEAGARDGDAAIAACALMIKGICLTRPQEVWVDDIKSRIRYMLAALAGASEAAEVPAGYKLVPVEPTVEMLNAALPHDVTFGHGFKRRIYQEMIAAAPQPASEQQDEMSICGMKVVVDPTMPPNEIKAVFPGDQQAARGLELPPMLTPFGMLVRALRIVAGTTLYDMAKALLTTPAKLSAMEFGRAEVTPEFAFDVAAYFDALGIACTESALRVAAAAKGDGHAE